MESAELSALKLRMDAKTSGLQASLGLADDSRRVVVLPENVPVDYLLGAVGAIVIDGVLWARESISDREGKDRYAVGGEREICGNCGGFLSLEGEVSRGRTCSGCDLPQPSGEMGWRDTVADRYEGAVCNPGVEQGYCVVMTDQPNRRASRVKGVSGDWEKGDLCLALKKVRFSGKTGADRLRFIDSSTRYFPAPHSAGLVLAYHPSGVLGILPIHPTKADDMTAAGVEVHDDIYTLVSSLGRRRLTLGGKAGKNTGAV